METALFLLLSVIAVYLFMRLGARRESGEFKSPDVTHALRKEKNGKDKN